MKIETLKKLIKLEFDKTNVISIENINQLKINVLNLFDLYEQDNATNYTITKIKENPCVKGGIYNGYLPDEVPYNEVCPCNPKNGGNGICGCVLPNKMIPNPKKYSGYSTTITSTNISDFDKK